MSFIYNLADTWNAVGTTFNSILMNVSDGAGGAPVGAVASRILNLQANSVSVFSVDVGGALRSIGGISTTLANPRWSVNNNSGTAATLQLGADSAVCFLGATTNNRLYFITNNIERASIPAAGGFMVGTAAILTTAVDGFLHIPTCAGPPTGVPNLTTGLVPLVFDSINSQFYIYTGGAWKQPKTPAGAAIVTWQ